MYVLEFTPLLNVDPPIRETRFHAEGGPAETAFQFGVWWHTTYPDIQATLLYTKHTITSTHEVSRWYVKHMREGQDEYTQVLGTLVLSYAP